MRSVVAIVLASSLVACPRVAPPTVVPPARVTAAEPKAAVAPRRMQPTDPPPVFVDPQRRAKLEAVFPAIDAYLQSTVVRDGLVGLAAGIVIDGELAWFRGYGLRDPARGLPVERDTVFGIGSITKTFTALAVLRLRDEGRVDLDRPAADYLQALDAIAYPTADSPRITIRHILTHTSGLPRMGDFPEYPLTPPNRAEFLATLDGLGLDRPPGERRVYSNLAFQLLGPLIEAVAGEDHRSHVGATILRPLGLTNTAWVPEDVPGDRLAVGHERMPGQPPRARPHWRPGAADAAGGLYSSVEDLARYAAFNLAAWPARDEPESGPLRRATLREAQSLAVLTSFSATSMRDGPAQASVSGSGLGFGVQVNCRIDHLVALAGKTLNYRAALLMLPTRGVAVILLSNLSSIASTALPNDGLKVVEILEGSGGLEKRRHAPSAPLLAAADALAGLVSRWDDEVHARLFSADYLDAYPKPQVAAQLAEWRAQVGECRDPRPVAIDDPRAGTFEFACERATLRVELRVAPWAAGTITSFTILEATGLAPAPAQARAGERFLRLLDRWSEREFAALFADNFTAAPMRAAAAEAAQQFGRCRLGTTKLSQAREAVFGLACERGAPTLRLKLDGAEPAKIVEFHLREAQDGPCR
ncbi:serine hydrolase domain-containing protein [Nannocystis radixulma]|uniref:Serine hydrolase n=1 Tax=Nannocystis radixulma TaxID=2995305 RepID=A0ABT5AXG7_9BACT|nr:serine hydrolase domain-containing protein [Nannocystis radixulma]MDC0666538.1 serine hydrolase [Nannocystis radixulma]